MYYMLGKCLGIGKIRGHLQMGKCWYSWPPL